jgi:hypothetical protein
VVDGRLARIQQQGDAIRVWDGDGQLSAASFSSAKTIVATNFGNLAGRLGLGRIDWADGSTWRKLDLSGEYKDSAGGRVRILSNGAGDLVLVNASGATTVSHWIDATHLVQTEWGGVTGLVQDARIQWSNGTTWTKNLHINGTTAKGGKVAIEVRQDSITLFNTKGPSSRARLVDDHTIYAIDWRITGTISGDQIQWSNGTVWKEFGFNALHAAFSDIQTSPFPNLFLTGNSGKGTTVSIEVRQNQIFLKDKAGNVSPAQLVSPGTIVAQNWNLTGTLKKNKINWSNGTVWQGFDTNLLNYVFGK